MLKRLTSFLFTFALINTCFAQDELKSISEINRENPSMLIGIYNTFATPFGSLYEEMPVPAINTGGVELKFLGTSIKKNSPFLYGATATYIKYGSSVEPFEPDSVRLHLNYYALHGTVRYTLNSNKLIKPFAEARAGLIGANYRVRNRASNTVLGFRDKLQTHSSVNFGTVLALGLQVCLKRNFRLEYSASFHFGGKVDFAKPDDETVYSDDFLYINTYTENFNLLTHSIGVTLVM